MNKERFNPTQVEHATEIKEGGERVATIEVSSRRTRTEDALAFREIMKDSKSCLISVVADGHGTWGGAIARTAVAFLTDAAVSADRSPDKGWIEQTFDNLEQEIEIKFLHNERGGSTVTFVWLEGRNIIWGYVGDSEAKIWKKDGTWKGLTRPHWYGAHPKETRRLVALNAQTLADRYTRESKRPRHILRPGDADQALAVSRAIGDTSFEPLVSHEPDVGTYILSPEDRFLLIASDGLWSQISRMSKRSKIDEVLSGARSVEEARQKLNEILSRWQGDDIAVILIDVAQKTDL